MIKHYIRITPAITPAGTTTITPAITPSKITPAITPARITPVIFNQNILASYNHFKPPKKAFNYNLYKSINAMSFWLVGMLERFKRYINKIFRLIINRVALEIVLISIKKILLKIRIICKNRIIFKMILISSFGWSKMRLELYLTNLLKIEQVPRFGVYLNLISE